MAGRMRTQKTTPELHEQAMGRLKELIRPGDTVYTAHQGNGTYIKLYVVKDGKIINITWNAGHAMQRGVKDREGEWVIHNPVVGMDRGFDLVYNLSGWLFFDTPKEELVGTHSHSGDKDRGYQLEHRWL